MSRDPVLRFTDSAGNGYVGLDVVDAENLAELLGVVLDVLCSLAHYENLADYLPARLDRITDLCRHRDYADTVWRKGPDGLASVGFWPWRGSVGSA